MTSFYNILFFSGQKRKKPKKNGPKIGTKNVPNLGDLRDPWHDRLHRLKPEGTIDKWQALCNFCGGCVATPFVAMFPDKLRGECEIEVVGSLSALRRLT